MNMKRMAFVPTLFFAGLLVSGCSVGILYTHTWQPLTEDVLRTPLAQSKKSGDIKHIQLPYVGVAWDSTAFGDIAKKNGITELYFADLETLRVLTIWGQDTVHLYGK
jgi:hypothetical protein